MSPCLKQQVRTSDSFTSVLLRGLINVAHTYVLAWPPKTTIMRTHTHTHRLLLSVGSSHPTRQSTKTLGMDWRQTNLLDLIEHWTGWRTSRYSQQHLEPEKTGTELLQRVCANDSVNIKVLKHAELTFSPGKMSLFLPSMALNLWMKYSLKQALTQTEESKKQ